MQLLQLVIREVPKPVKPSARDSSRGRRHPPQGPREGPGQPIRNRDGLRRSSRRRRGELSGHHPSGADRLNLEALGSQPPVESTERRHTERPLLDSSPPHAARTQRPNRAAWRRGNNERRSTSWHSKDPNKAVSELIDQRQELGLGNLPLAASCAESALEIAASCSEESVKELISKNSSLLERIFIRKLGSPSSTLSIRLTRQRRAVSRPSKHSCCRVSMELEPRRSSTFHRSPVKSPWGSSSAWCAWATSPQP